MNISDENVSFDEFFRIYKQKIIPELDEIEKLRISNYNALKKEMYSSVKLAISVYYCL